MRCYFSPRRINLRYFYEAVTRAAGSGLLINSESGLMLVHWKQSDLHFIGLPVLRSNIAVP